eukprot:404580_1
MEDVSSKEHLRVICRLKPNSDEESVHKDEESNEETNTICIYPSDVIDEIDGISNGISSKPLKFEFDGILNRLTSQETTFDVVAKKVVEDVLNGYNSTIFCYGSTTSGKTHTIFGKEDSSDPTMIGLLPRCVAYCIHLIKESRDVVEASITISCIEIYEEQLKDLISPEISSKLKICLSPSGDTYVENLTQTFMQSANDALKMVEVIKLNRTKIAKNSIYSSHRSHCLACLTIKQKLSNNTSRKAKCYFGDLASTDSTPNDQSLNILQLVIHSLSIKKPLTLIPYNNSSLTKILKDSLGGNTKTTIIINIAMNKLKRKQTINSLRFGQRARLITNNIKLNKELNKYEMKQLIYSLKLQLNKYENKYQNQKYEKYQVKYDKLLKQHEKEEEKQNIKYLNLENNYNKLIILNNNQKNEIQLLNKQINNHIDNHELFQKKINNLSQKNNQL